jgi:hypothetical protein
VRHRRLVSSLVIGKGRLESQLTQDRAARVAAGDTGREPMRSRRRNVCVLSLSSMRAGAALLVGVVVLSGCGGSGHGDTSATESTSSTTGAPSAKITGKLPPRAVGPTDTAEEAAGPAATEASPESAAAGPSSTGELSSAGRSAVTAVVDDYVAALNRHDARLVCALLEPDALDPGMLPDPRGGCRHSLRDSIGARPRGGGPAWRRTTVVEVKPERLADDRARVTATVTHHFSDRKYVSVEDDVIYLELTGDRWLLAQPSATLYRAVGYSQPPLRAFSPPPGW